MHQDEITALFERHAPNYDQQWVRLAPIRDALFLLMETRLANLPDATRVLCVGAGTGAEAALLAARHPTWHFTLVEPAAAMLDRCRQRAEQEGFAARCHFHHGYLETLDEALPSHQVATCLLVSQFLLDREARVALFARIAARLAPDGVLVSADLARGEKENDFERLVEMWLAVMSGASVSPEQLERGCAAYTQDVAVLNSTHVEAILEDAGFSPVTRFFQAGLLHAWLATR